LFLAHFYAMISLCRGSTAKQLSLFLIVSSVQIYSSTVVLQSLVNTLAPDANVIQKPLNYLLWSLPLATSLHGSGIPAFAASTASVLSFVGSIPFSTILGETLIALSK